ncbi:MAG: hypothetical protein Q4G40_07365 [Brachybacterium sp.]|nr:hypothetical protein [Brachybacterium sp.]
MAENNADPQVEENPAFADLLAGYPPIYNAQLAPEDFSWMNGEWHAALRLEGQHRRVSLRGTGDDMTCSLDGEPATFPHPYRKTLAESFGSAQLWFDHFARLTVPTGRPMDAPWDRTSQESMLWRIEHNIVAYEYHEIATQDLRSVYGVQAWLDEHLTATQVEATVLPMGEWPLLPNRNAHRGSMAVHMDNGEISNWEPVKISPDLTPEQFFRPGRSHTPVQPRVRMHTEGREIVSSMGCTVLHKDNDELPPLTRPAADASPPWILLHVVGTACVVPLPLLESTLAVAIDDDGATVELSVHGAESRARQLYLRDMYERHWGRFLDEQVALTEDELNEGIRIAEHRIREAEEGDRQEETNQR